MIYIKSFILFTIILFSFCRKKDEDLIIENMDKLTFDILDKKSVTDIILSNGPDSSSISSVTVQDKEIKLEVNTVSLKRSPVLSKKRQIKKESINIGLLYSCHSLSEVPKTCQEAFQCSQHFWRNALFMFERDMLDSAYTYCIKSLSIYENGSLFSLKASLLYNMTKYSDAIQSAEISISKNDHWLGTDKEQAYRIRFLALQSLYRKYPSKRLMQSIDNAFNDYEKYRSGR